MTKTLRDRKKSEMISSNSLKKQTRHLLTAGVILRCLLLCVRFNVLFATLAYCFHIICLPGIDSIMNASLCHSGVVLMKTEYTNQEHNSSTAMQHNATSTITTTVKQTRYFTVHYRCTYGLRAGVAQSV